MTTVATGQVLLAGTPPAGLAASFAALHIVSLACAGSIDYAGPSRNLRYRSPHVAFRPCKSVSVLIASFRSSIPSPPVPLFTLRAAPHDAVRKTRGRAVRYSFLAGLFHSLLHAGLARRTTLAIWRSLNSGDWLKSQDCRSSRQRDQELLPWDLAASLQTALHRLLRDTQQASTQNKPTPDDTL